MEQKLPISLFAYNFPHKKTQDFIFRILAEGYKISVIYAADPVKLDIPKSTIKSKVNHIGLIHPKKIANSLGIKYIVAPHDSVEIIEDAKNNPSIAVISGARILKKSIIDCFPLGIINFHPGIIPYARGLDALFWSIYNDCLPGVTAHLIDGRVDAGKILSIQHIEVLSDDTLLDLSERLYEIQLDMLPLAIEKVINNEGYFLENYGAYNKKMETELENQLINILPQFINKWKRD